MNFLHRAADHLRSRNIFVHAKDIFGTVVSVDVSRSKIHWNVFFFAVRKEAGSPSSLRCSGAADAEAGAHALDGAGSAVVKVVISSFFGIAGPEVDVRLVPDFEIPLRDFVDTVALDKVTREILDELFPLAPVLRRRDILLVPERMQRVRVGGKFLGHEAELDERTNMILQQAVVDLIDIGEVVDGAAVFVFVVEAGFIVEDGMEAVVFKAGDALGFTQVVAVALAKAKDGAPRPKHFSPEVGEG